MSGWLALSSAFASTVRAICTERTAGNLPLVFLLSALLVTAAGSAEAIPAPIALAKTSEIR